MTIIECVDFEAAQQLKYSNNMLQNVINCIILKCVLNLKNTFLKHSHSISFILHARFSLIYNPELIWHWRWKLL